MARKSILNISGHRRRAASIHGRSRCIKLKIENPAIIKTFEEAKEINSRIGFSKSSLKATELDLKELRRMR